MNGFPTAGSGTIKNIQPRGTTGKVFTANVSMRNEEGKCVVTMPLVFIDKSALVNSIKDGDSVQFSGFLVTRFDRRPGIENSLRGKPYTQIAIETIENKSIVQE
jgi:hypothetical protein